MLRVLESNTLMKKILVSYSVLFFLGLVYTLTKELYEFNYNVQLLTNQADVQNMKYLLMSNISGYLWLLMQNLFGVVVIYLLLSIRESTQTKS